MRAAIATWVSGQAGAVPTVWSKQNSGSGGGVPSPSRPFVLLTELVPPIRSGFLEGRNYGISVQVTSAVSGATYTITINSVASSYVAGPNDTVTTIRDALIAQLVANLILDPYAILSDTLTLGGAPNTISLTANLNQVIAQEYLGDSIATFSVDAFYDPPQGASTDEAITLISRLRLSLETDPVLEQLSTAGWAYVSVEGLRKPDQLIGSRWEDRAGFDVRLRCRSRSIQIINYIDTVTIGTGITGSFSNS
jgi:hypothetical protein